MHHTARTQLSPADLNGQRRRLDYPLGIRPFAAMPDADDRTRRLAEWHELAGADVTRLQAQLARHDGLLGCEGWLGALPDDAPAPTAPAQRYAAEVASLSAQAATLATWQADDDSRQSDPGDDKPAARSLRPLGLVLIVSAGIAVAALWHGVARLFA